MLKILAIDNNNDNLISLKAIISDAFPGSTVFTAQNGPDGIKLAIANNPDVILLDIILPGMNGFEVGNQLKQDEQTSNIPVVFLTALRGDKGNRIKALEAGAEGFLFKPIDEAELIVQVKAMIKIKAAMEQKRNEKERMKKLVEERTIALQNELKERIIMEAASRESEERFRNIFTISPDAIAITEFETGKFVEINPSFEKLSGFTRDEIIGKTSLELGFWLDANAREKYINTLKTIGFFNDQEISFRIKSGNIIHTIVSSRVITLSGQLLMLNVIKDNTERKIVERKIQKSEERFRHISTSISDISYACKINSEGDSSIDWLYGATEKITGYTINELIEMKCWGKIVVDEDFPIFKIHILGALPGTSEVCQFRLRKKDGGIVWIQATAECIKGTDEMGFRSTLYGGLVDITGSKRMETELIAAKEKAEKSEQQLIVRNKELIERNSFIQTILDNLPIGIALNKIDEGRATYMNKKFEEIYGWSSDEIISIGSFFEHVFPDADYRNKLTGKIIADIQSGNPERMHWENLFVTRKDGDKKIVNAVNIPLMEQNTMVSTVIDITELHKTQNDLLAAKEKAEESDRLKSAFLANMSHEIRTPLNSIIGFSELMADPDLDAVQQSEFAQLINDSGTNLLAIITDIMDISKIEAGQVQVKKELLSVNHLLADIQKEYAYKAIKKGIELRLDPINSKDMIVIESDKTKLRQVLVNLVGNAVKFTQEGYIELGIQAVSDRVQFHVKDTGIGIPIEYHNQIFERFRQVEAFDTRKYGGNGLGLAISKSLVELLGGKMWLESEIGKGSTFYFAIPIKD